MKKPKEKILSQESDLAYVKYVSSNVTAGLSLILSVREFIHSCRSEAHSPYIKCPSASTTPKGVEVTTHHHTPNLKTTPLSLAYYARTGKIASHLVHVAHRATFNIVRKHIITTRPSGIHPQRRLRES